MKHRYLFTLEITPVEAGKTYNELPPHLTFMSRFFSELPPERLTEVVRRFFEQTKPLELLFEETTELGPKKHTVHMVAYSDELKLLHSKLRDLLDSVNVDYEYPQFVGKGHRPHVTKRDNIQFNEGSKKIVNTACLVEVIDRKRIIRSRFKLSGSLRGQLLHRQQIKTMTNKLVNDIFTEQLSTLPRKKATPGKSLVLFSGVPGSGKTTIAQLIEKQLGAIRLSNDKVRKRIVELHPTVSQNEREKIKFDLATKMLEYVLLSGYGLVVVDASCDRGYDFYYSLAKKYNYSILLLRMSVSRQIIEQRYLTRHTDGSEALAGALSQLNTWWQQWKQFGKEHKPDMIIRQDTPTAKVLELVRNHHNEGSIPAS